MKFEKIKTAADKRVALEKRGKETSVDLKAGNVLFVTEKLDGFNASFDTFGNTYSRSGQLPEDMKHHQKLVPFKEMVTTNLTKAVKNFLNPLHEYQVFGEDSLENRFLNKVFIFCTNYVENHNIYFKGKNDISWFINYIRPSFEHIGTDVNIQEIRNYKHNPFFKEYKEAIKIGQQILKRFSYNITKTTNEKLSTPPFWIDMPKMFELYVYAQLLKDNPELNADNFNYQFSTNGNALDFLICTSDKKLVIDTKYKLKYNYGKIHEDIRQVAGYARLNKVRNQSPVSSEEVPCLIIYPKPIETEVNTKLVLNNLPVEKINAYHKVCKIGINLPIIK